MWSAFLPCTEMIKGLESPLIPFFDGTPGWVRTSGFQLRRLTLYPLSYGRMLEIRGRKSDDREQISSSLVQMTVQVKLK